MYVCIHCCVCVDILSGDCVYSLCVCGWVLASDSPDILPSKVSISLHTNSAPINPQDQGTAGFKALNGRYITMCSFLRKIACHHAGPSGQTLTQQTSSPSGEMNGSWLQWSIPL